MRGRIQFTSIHHTERYPSPASGLEALVALSHKGRGEVEGESAMTVSVALAFFRNQRSALRLARSRKSSPKLLERKA